MCNHNEEILENYRKRNKEMDTMNKEKDRVIDASSKIIAYHVLIGRVSLEYHQLFGEVRVNDLFMPLDTFLERDHTAEELEFISDLKKLGEIS